MAAARLLPTARTQRWYLNSRPKRIERRRGDTAPALLSLILAVSLFTISCSEKQAPTRAEAESETDKKETDEEPREDEIAEDCVAFVRATKVVPQVPVGDCPGCTVQGSDALAFREMKVQGISCSANCEVTVTLRVAFNPAPAGTVSGGLTAWISQEQRLQYLNGKPPEGEPVYRVKITYKRTANGWRAIEFDKADPK
jgi:hypothetical protein